MDKISALLYVKPESSFSYLGTWMAGHLTDYNCAACDDKETFMTMIVNGYPDIILIENTINSGSGLDCIETLRNEQIDVPFVLLMDEFDEATTKKLIELGGLAFILRTDDLFAVRQKLIHTKLLIQHGTKKEFTKVDSRQTARLDELTAVPGRPEFMNRLRDGAFKSLLLLNIDDFGPINDAYGVAVGDKILKETAHVIGKLVTHGSSLYRISGDEFAIIVSGPDVETGHQLIKRIRNVFAKERIMIESLELTISFTIGFASGKDPSILQKADIALRRAREIGRNRYQEYRHDPELEEKQKDNLLWAQKIAKAIEDDLFFPYYQPIVDNNGYKVEMYECLARMLDSGMIILPGLFIETAKRSGLMPHITRSILEKSFESFSNNSYAFSVNICEPDLRENFLVPFIGRLFEKYPATSGRFIVEISEGVESVQHQADVDQIMALKNLGVKIAFDDFGKGNSNFCRILDLMPDFIKIDGGFIEHLDHNGRGFKISHAITEFGKSIDSKVIAEYVHSKQILDRVHMLDVQYSQGFYFGKPQRTVTGKIDQG
jgi:diguanylate cyclase (GGDEF)-like protein